MSAPTKLSNTLGRKHELFLAVASPVLRAMTARWPLLTVAALGLILPNLSIPFGHMVIGGDGIYPELDPSIAWQHLSGSWEWASGLGIDAALAKPIFFPFVCGDIVMRDVGLSPEIINRVWLSVTCALQGVAPIALLDVLWPWRVPPMALLAAGAVALLNPLVLITLHGPFLTTNLSTALAPLVVTVGVLFVRKPGIRLYATFLALAFVAATGDFNLGLFAVELLFALLILLLAGRTRVAESCALLLGYLGVNAAYVVPCLRGGVVAQVGQEWRNYSLDTLRVTSLNSGLPHSLRMIGEYLFFNNSAGAPYFPAGPGYDSNPFLIAATCWAPLLAFVGVFLGLRTRDGVVKAITVVGAVGLFLAKGAAPPFGQIYEWFVRSFSAAYAFRDSFAKFEWVVPVCYALLAGFVIMRLSRYARAWIPTAVAALTILAAGASAFPAFEGGLFWPHVVVAVPARYASFASRVNRSWPHLAIATLPAAEGFFDAYSWGYIGSGINSQLFSAPVLSGEFRLLSPVNEALISALEDYPQSTGSDGLAPLLGLYGFGAILSDTSLQQAIFYGTRTPGIDFGDVPPSLRLLLASDGLALYRIRNSDLNPTLYVATSLFTGTNSPAQEAAVCLAMGCSRAAFVGEDVLQTAELTGAVASFDYGGFKAGRNETVLTRPSIFHGAPSQRRTRLQTYVDYANGTEDPTNGVDLPTRYVGFGTSPAVLHVVLGRAPQRGAYANVAVDWLRPNNALALPVEICAGPGQSLTRQYIPALGSVSGTSENGVVAVTMRTSRSANAVVAYSNGSDYVWFVPPDGRLHDFVRLMSLSSTSWMRITVEGGASGGCADVRYLALGLAPLDSSSSALTSPISPYMAQTGGSFPSDYTESYHRVSAGGSVRRQARSLSGLNGWFTTSPQWEGPDVDAPAGAVPSQVVALTRERAQTSITARKAEVDVYATLGRTYSGFSCVASVVARSRRPTQIQMAVVDDAHAPIAASNFDLTTSPQALHLAFTPKDDAEVTVYEYINATLAPQADVSLSQPSMDCALPTTSLRILGSARQEHVPGTHVQQSSDGWQVNVSNDVRPFLLVLNESFDPSWQMTASDARVVTEHVVAGVGVNAWLVMGPGTYTLSVRYNRAQSYTTALVIAGSLLFAGLVLVGWTIARRRSLRSPS